jgi:metal-sulfur cluster biosynthetic enzyme
MSNDETKHLTERILTAANQILEPCGLGQGFSIGMVDMGLIGGVDVERGDSGWRVKVSARVTSPDCLHFVYFERELRSAIMAIGNIDKIDVEWGDCSEWSPDQMAPRVREQMQERRRKRLATIEQVRETPVPRPDQFVSSVPDVLKTDAARR